MNKTSGIHPFLYKAFYPLFLVFIVLFMSCGTGTNSIRETRIVPIVDTASDHSYRIGPEDVLQVSVWKNRELTLDNVVVRPDGRISMPLVQDLQAEGLTSEELADLIQQKLLPYIKDPVVSVIVQQVNSSRIFIVGSVAKPGTYALRGNLTMLQALSMAGGFTQFASPKDIRLVRKKGQNQEIRMINYYDLIESGEGNYLLLPGDTIVVP